MLLLLMGERYGVVQPSGLPATHEEYREARECKPVPGSITLDRAGSICISQLALREGASRRAELPASIEEDLTAALASAIHFTGCVLDRVDPLRRPTDAVVVAHLSGSGYMAWRTRAEQAASPNAATMGIGGDETTVMLTPARRYRQALTHDADRIAEDLTTLLRREQRR